MEFFFISVIFAVSFLCVNLAGRNVVEGFAIPALIVFLAAGALFAQAMQMLLANTVTSILTGLG